MSKTDRLPSINRPWGCEAVWTWKTCSFTEYLSHITGRSNQVELARISGTYGARNRSKKSAVLLLQFELLFCLEPVVESQNILFVFVVPESQSLILERTKHRTVAPVSDPRQTMR